MGPYLYPNTEQGVKVTLISLFVTAGEDYVALHSAPLILASESGRGCVEVAIIPDDLLEDTENFSISLNSSTTISPTVTISIIDTSKLNTPLNDQSPYNLPRSSCMHDWGAKAGGRCYQQHWSSGGVLQRRVGNCLR